MQREGHSQFLLGVSSRNAKMNPHVVIVLLVVTFHIACAVVLYLVAMWELHADDVTNTLSEAPVRLYSVSEQRSVYQRSHQ